MAPRRYPQICVPQETWKQGSGCVCVCQNKNKLRLAKGQEMYVTMKMGATAIHNTV